MNTKRMIAVLAVFVMAFAAFAVIPTDGISGDDEKEIVYMHGEVTSTLKGTTDQKVIIDQDMTIKTNGQVVIEGDLEVKSGVTVTIEDGTVYNDGSKRGIFTIFGDATINGDIISKVADGLDIEPNTDCTVTINGNITALGDTSGTTAYWVIYMEDDSTAASEKEIIVNGTVTVGTNAHAEIDLALFTENSKFINYGTVGGEIVLFGYAYFDGMVSTSTDKFTIRIGDKGAVVDIKSVSGSPLKITDKKMYVDTYGGVQYFVEEMPTSGSGQKATIPKYDADNGEFVYDNQSTPAYVPAERSKIEFQDVTNIKVVMDVKTAVAYDKKISDNMIYAEIKMVVSPLDTAKNVEAAQDATAASITVTGGEDMRFDTMTINDVAITIDAGAAATVIGDITVLRAATPKEFTVDGKLTVEGLVLMKKDQTITGTGAVIAAKYTVKDADNLVDTYYTTLQQAMDNGAENITMFGTLIVDKDLTVKAPVKVTLDKAATPEAVKVVDGATFTIADGAKLDGSGAQYVVAKKGAIVYENINYGITINEDMVRADVKLQDGQYVMYTDIYNALAKAKAGDKVEGFQPISSTVIIDKDLILPAGVTYDNNTWRLYVMNGATFTIAGTLYLDDDTLITNGIGNGWNTKTPAADASGAVKDYSVLVIADNGIIQIENAKSLGLYDVKFVDGAYFKMDVDHTVYSCITNVALAFSKILDAESKTVNLKGDITIDNLKVSGTEKERVIVEILADSKITMKNFTFAYAKISADVGVKFTGDIGTATGKMIFNEATVPASKTITFEEVLINDAMNLQVTGTIKSDNQTEIAGIVYLNNFIYSPTSTSGAAYKLLTYAEKRFTVPAGTAAFIGGTSGKFTDVELLVAGELTVLKGSTLKLDDDTFLSVTGTLTVPKIDTGVGALNAVNLIIGGSTDSFRAIETEAVTGVALVTGDGEFSLVDLAAVYVFNGSKVAADVLADWMENTAVNSEFYIDGALWMTAYAYDDSTITIAKTTRDTSGTEDVITTEYNLTPVIENMKFNGWQTYDEKTKTYKAIVASPTDPVPPGTTSTAYVDVGQAGYTKVYADLTKEIYDIVVTADVGIDNIYIDGKIILKDKTSNTFTEKVSAGTHTIAYTLANGYSGNASITAIDGKTITGSGLTFVIDDDKAGTDMKMEITVSGIEKSGYDTDPETHDEKATGLTTTEILLIVVVVIIAIMAVVLILRLNRS